MKLQRFDESVMHYPLREAAQAVRTHQPEVAVRVGQPINVSLLHCFAIGKRRGQAKVVG